MEFIKRAVEQIKTMWGNLTSSQRVLVSAIAVAIVLLTVWGATSSSTESMTRLAGYDVSEGQRSQILTWLQENNQRHEVRPDGIYVPRAEQYRLALEMAGQGFLDGAAIWKFLDEPSILDSRWDKEKKNQRAIQFSLEAMIRTIDSVRNARVILNPGSDRARLGFASEAKPGASVQVELHANKKLTTHNVKAIAGAVARSVEGLTMDQVHIMDTSGRPYQAREAGDLALSSTIREMEMQMEERIAKKLEAFFPGSMVIVRYIANAKRTKTNSIEYGKRAIFKEEERKKADKGTVGGATPGIKGESALDPTQAGGTLVKNDKTESEARSEGYPDRKVVDVEDPGGQFEKMSAAVKWAVKADENGELDQAYVTANLTKVQDVVRLALGPGATAEDVTIFPFAMSAPAPLPETPMMEKIMEMAAAHWAKVVLLLLSLFGLLIVIRIAKSAMPTEMVQEIKSIRSKMDEEERAMEEAAAPTADEASKIKSSIRDMVAKNPVGGGLTLNQWMEGK